MELKLNVKNIEMSEETVSKITILGYKLKNEFEYMGKYRLTVNNDIKFSKCKINYDNGMSCFMDLDFGIKNREYTNNYNLECISEDTTEEERYSLYEKLSNAVHKYSDINQVRATNILMSEEYFRLLLNHNKFLIGYVTEYKFMGLDIDLCEDVDTILVYRKSIK